MKNGWSWLRAYGAWAMVLSGAATLSACGSDGDGGGDGDAGMGGIGGAGDGDGDGDIPWWPT
jgi:hypothetical protein